MGASPRGAANATDGTLAGRVRNPTKQTATPKRRLR
jgi:hypothetical protein